MEGTNSDERPTKRLKTSSEQNEKNGMGESADTVSGSSQVDAINSAVKNILAKEQRVGIAAFIGEHQTTITGTFKQRYTDFLVNEVLPDGTVLHLQNTTHESQAKGRNSEKVEASQSTNSKDTNKAEVKPSNSDATNGDEPSGTSKISDEDRAQLVKFLGEEAVVGILALFASITENPKKRSREHPIVNTPFTSDRMVRTEIHQAIRRIFHSRVDSSTNKEGILVLSAANPNFRNNHQSRVGKLSWIERGGEHCHFTLYKEMKDTMESIGFLAYMIKKNSRDFQIAGTKDRRAATVQRVSVFRVEAERLAALNRSATLKNAMLGDFSYHSSGLQLGDLSGNEFTITVRDVRFTDGSNDPSSIQDTFSTTLASLHTNGFLNYYGLQRFGTFAIGSDILGLQVLKGDFEGACNSILDYNDSALADDESNVGRDDRARAQAIKIFRDTNSIKDSLDIMPKRLSAETAVIRALGKNPSDHLGALMLLQRNMRQMYVHAYQSLIWNKATTERWRLYGSNVVEGDLVLVAEHKDKEISHEQEIEPEGEVIIHAAGNDRARGGANDDAFERARPLSADEAAGGHYSIFDIVLPLPGFDVLYPKNDSGDKFYKEVMAQDGLDPYDMRRPQKDFSLSGSYRKVVGRINGDYDVQMRRYTQEEEQFVVTDRERLLKKNNDRKNMKDSDGDEKMAENGIDGKASNNTDTNADASNDAIKSPPTNNGNTDAQTQQKTAAILKFQLGTSQYATMALRELSGGGLMEYKPGFSGGR